MTYCTCTLLAFTFPSNDTQMQDQRPLSAVSVRLIV